tara:strand:- start:1942 stop:2349 length:408 start_codon:yes stop_codon:yes gene_type:complete
MNISNTISNFIVKVYYEDTDAAGIVYHSKYLNFAERARTEFLKNIGCYQSIIYKENKIRFVVRKLKIDYTGYAILDDSLKVTTCIKFINKAKIIFLQKIIKKSKILTNIEVIVCCIKENGTVARMPNELYYKIIN